MVSFESARNHLKNLLKSSPFNFTLILFLGILNAVLFVKKE
jgi:hypothetical protein